MRLWQWVWGWVWLVGLGATETAPSPESAKILAPEAEPPLFIDGTDFFDYPDLDQARLLALAQFIGERPVVFDNSGAARKGPKELDKGPALCQVPKTALVSR
nr:uncharacterized protein C16orf92 homolog isoform X3 [Equus caballus]